MPDTAAPSTDLAVRPTPAVPPPPPLPSPPAWVKRRESSWPGPRVPAGPVPAIAAVVAGVLVAGFVPFGYLGVGWVLAGFAVVLAVAVSLRRPAARPVQPDRPDPAPDQPDPATPDSPDLTPSGQPEAADRPEAGAAGDPRPTPNGEPDLAPSGRPEPAAGPEPAPEPAPAGAPATTPAAASAASAAASAAAPAAASAAAAAPGRAGWRWEPLAWGVAALALLSVGAFRAAEWLFGLSLFGAAVATVLAVTGGRTLRGMVFGALLMPAAGWRGVDWARRGLGGLRRKPRAGARLGPTIAITVAILVLFGALFASADAVFSRLLGFAIPDIEAAPTIRWIVLFGAGGTVVLGAVFLMLAPPTVDNLTPGRPRIGLVEWVVPVGALVALFASFVGVQLTVLFGGVTYVLEADGLTYAEYARGGFWQLLTVTALTLLVIGVVARLAPRGTPVERWCLRGLLGVLALLTLVIVASALFRMHTYQEAYGFTRLRLLVSVGELWLGVVFVLVLAAGVRLRAGWLPRAVAATGIVALLALAALNPDRFIAERNLDRWQAGERLDTAYLAELSADAVPALVCLEGPERSAALYRVEAEIAALPSDWRRSNLGHAIARARLSEGSAACR